jgi:multisubunit Na+/H+ antiporter MnhE subunit
VKHVVPWLVWWLGLFWLWLLLAGEWNRQEWIAAAVAATIAASLAELARVRTGFAARLPRRALADVPQVLAMVVVDFGVVIWALLASLARRDVVRGALVSRDLERGARAADGVGPRAWTALAASYSPNAYVIDIEPDAQTVLLHDLVPSRRSESPA